MALKGKQGMRWHPLMIKWCLYLKSLSTTAYETLQDVVQLPSTRTLRDYTHWMTAKPGIYMQLIQLHTSACYFISPRAYIGIHTDALEDLASKIDKDDSRCVALLLDEMKIKEDLVFNKHSGHIMGYVNLGNVEQQLLLLEKEDQSLTDHVATHVLQFMVRGLSQRLEYPVAHFATSTLTASQLYSMVWEVICKLESLDLKVMVITADGAAVNRKFFRMHLMPSRSNVSNGVVYKTTNPFDPEREVFFISDVPHLIKTTRNCWEKSRFGGGRLMKVELDLTIICLSYI